MIEKIAEMEDVLLNSRSVSACLALILAALAGCNGPSGPLRYPVKGIVKVNGKPAERMAVLFHHENPKTPSSLRYPTGVTDADGRFQLSSMEKNDGAIAGKYAITFTWLSSPELSAYDMLNGLYGNASSSDFEVEIPVAGDGEVVLALDIPEAQIRRPSSPAQGAESAQPTEVDAPDER